MPKPLYESLKQIGRSTALAMAVFEVASFQCAYGQAVTGQTADDDTFTFASFLNPTISNTLNSGGNDTVILEADETLTNNISGSNGTLVRLGGDGFTVINAGTIANTSASANIDGITATNGTGEVFINNSGVIETFANITGVTAGIQVANTNGTIFTNLTVINSGRISSTRQGIFLGFAGTPSSATASNITNRSGGLIQATSGTPTGGTGNQALSLGNAIDTVINEAGATIDGQILLFNGDDALTNSGRLIDTAVLNFGNGNDVFTNAGTVEAVTIDLGNNDDTLTNSGVIDARTINFRNGTNTLNNTADGVINLEGTNGNGQDRISDTGGTFVLNNDGDIILAGTTTNFDVFHIRGSLTVNNTGLIENRIDTASTPTGTDVFVNVTGGVTNITNSGRIIAPAGQRALLQVPNTTATIDNQTGGEIQGIIDLNNSNDTITNAGSITGDIRLDGGDDTVVNSTGGTIEGLITLGTGNDTITNSGTITRTPDGGTSAQGVIELLAGADRITNNAGGLIDATGTDRAAIRVEVSTADAIINAGTLRATNQAVVLAGGNTDLTGGITNQVGGLISGTTGVQLSGGAVISGGISNAGTIEGTGGTAIQFDGLNQVTPITIAEGRIIGDVLDSNAANGRSPVTVTGSGFRTEGDFTVSDLTVNAGQDFTIRAGDAVNLDRQSNSAGTLRFEVGQLSVARLNVTGAGQGINLEDATVEATIDPNRALADGDEILIGTGNAQVIGLTGVAGQMVTDITDDSALFDFAIADGGQADVFSDSDNSNLFLLATRLATAEEMALTSNTQQAGAVIDQLSDTTDPQLVALVNQAALAPTPEALEDLVQSTLPDVDRSSLDVASQLTNHTVRLVSDRLTVIRQADANGPLAPERLVTVSHHEGPADLVAPDDHTTFQTWAQVFGQRIDRESSGAVAGFDANSYGFSVGIDTGQFSEDAVVGVALSYSDTDVQSGSINRTQTDIDSFNLTLYGDYQLDDESYLVGDAGLTFSQHDATRFDVAGVAGQNAEADFDSLQFSARLIAAREVLLDDGWVLTPKALVRYVRFDTDSFTETGAGGASLSVGDAGSDILEFGVIADLRKQFDLDDGGLLSTDVSVGYRYDVIGEAVETTSSFVGGGPAFVSQGADPDQGTLNLGAGVGYTAPDRWELTLNYDYELRGDTESHAANVRLAIPF